MWRIWYNMDSWGNGVCGDGGNSGLLVYVNSGLPKII